MILFFVTFHFFLAEFHSFFGKDTVKQSDAKEWAIRMSEKGYAYKTIDNYKRSLKASFYMAIQDDCIRKNPFEFKLSDVLEDDTEQKVILTPEQEDRKSVV